MVIKVSSRNSIPNLDPSVTISVVKSVLPANLTILLIKRMRFHYETAEAVKRPLIGLEGEKIDF